MVAVALGPLSPNESTAQEPTGGAETSPERASSPGQPPAAADARRRAQSRALFDAGIALSDRERWREAEDRFRRALTLHPSSVIAYNLATALMHTGRLVEASELLRGVTRDESARRRLRDAAARGLESVEPRIGWLTVRVEGSAADVSLYDNDRAVARVGLGVPMPADPGPHIIRATRDGTDVASAEANVEPGGEAEVTLTVPEPEPDAPPVVEAEPSELAAPVVPIVSRDEPAPASDDTGLWIGIGIGAGVLVIAAVAIILAVTLTGGLAEPIDGNLMPGTVEFGP